MAIFNIINSPYNFGEEMNGFIFYVKYNGKTNIKNGNFYCIPIYSFRNIFKVENIYDIEKIDFSYIRNNSWKTL
jgi:hypothetical protein